MIEDYVLTALSCRDLRVQYDVDVREFVILACLKDLDVAGAAEISRTVGLAPTTVMACLASLLANRLVRHDKGPSLRTALTTDGLALVRKAARHPGTKPGLPFQIQQFCEATAV